MTVSLDAIHSDLTHGVFDDNPELAKNVIRILLAELGIPAGQKTQTATKPCVAADETQSGSPQA